MTLILAFTSDTTAYAAELPYEVSQASVAATQCGGPGREPNSLSHGPLKLELLPGVCLAGGRQCLGRLDFVVAR